MKFKFLLFTILLSSLTATLFAHPLFDSIGVENQNGKKVILHKLDPHESFFSLGRKYNVPPQTIIDFNKNGKMQIGDIIKVPTELPFADKPTTHIGTPAKKGAVQTMQYKVSPGETLFGIAKKFGSTVDELIDINGLKSNTLQPGQILMVKSTNPGANDNVPAAAPVTTQPIAKQTVPVSNQPVTQPFNKPATTVKPAEKAEDMFVEKPTDETKLPPKRDSSKTAAQDSTDYAGHHIAPNKYGLN